MADPALPTKQNATLCLGSHPCWFYFNKPQNMACHDLTTHAKPPMNFRKLLGLGLNFCPRPRYTSSARDLDEAKRRLRKDLFTKAYFAGAGDRDDFDRKLFVASKWEPPPNEIPQELRSRLLAFSTTLQARFKKRRSPSNLLPCQRHALRQLASSEEIIVIRSDKNLGPAVIERETYIIRCFDDHLHDQDTYRELTREEAGARLDTAAAQVKTWLTTHKEDLTKKEKKYIRASLKVTDRQKFPQFYITAKVHKTPWKTRPIVSVSGSILHGFGVWIDRQLQTLGRQTPAFISSSWDLAKELRTLPALPPTARLFTADAVSMYTNIDTEHALKKIKTMVPRHVHSALQILMTNSAFQFSDTFWLQVNGTAMGVPPACMWATLYFSKHETKIMEHFGEYLLYYKRYIDDVFGAWNFDGTARCAQRYNYFKTCMDRFKSLRWEFSEPALSVDFLDMTITLNNGSFETRLFEKQLNLYLYLPPTSAHPTGVLHGLITGMILRIFRLTSDKTRCTADIQRFYNRLIARGYSSKRIAPVFYKCIARFATGPLEKSPATPETDGTDFQNTVFLHVPYHPLNPPSTDLQKDFRNILLDHRWRDPRSTPLPEIKNHIEVPIGVNRMIVAYHRPRNLANLLTPRRIDKTPGPPASAYNQ